MSPVLHIQAEQPRQSRGRLLIVDRDPLARWSLATYLQRWFSAAATDSLDDARQLLDAQDVCGIVVSDDLPGREIDLLEAEARRRNPHVAAIRTVTGVNGAKRPTGDVVLRLEKPYRLADVARLLGVPADELRDES